jgi:hypothetical protein
VGPHFAFAFLKAFLKEYVGRILAGENSQKMFDIDSHLTKQHIFADNLRFFCLKLIRGQMPIKEIKEKFIKIKRYEWITML